MPTHVFIPKSACSLLFHLTELTKESHVWLHERVTWCIPTHDIVCLMKPVMGKMLQWLKKALTGVLNCSKTILCTINWGCLIDFMTWCIPSWHHGRFNMKRDFHSHCTAVMLQHALWLYFTVQYILLSQLVMTHHIYVKWKIALLQNLYHLSCDSRDLRHSFGIESEIVYVWYIDLKTFQSWFPLKRCHAMVSKLAKMSLHTTGKLRRGGQLESTILLLLQSLIIHTYVSSLNGIRQWV